MAKRFKFRFCRVISSFQLCRSKKASSLPETPVSAIHRLSPVNPKGLDISYPNLNQLPAPPPSTPTDYNFIKHLSPAVGSGGCRAGSWSTEYLSPEFSFDESSGDFSWKKDATRLHIVAKAQNSKLQRNGDKVSVLVRKKQKIMEKVKGNGGASVSSRESGCFSSELGAENEETESLISTSRSFSDDSSELDQLVLAEDSHIETKKNMRKAVNYKMKRLRSFGSRTKTKAKLTGALPPPPPPRTAEGGKVEAESVAVVKTSEDPYEDFKRSMLEMILEKQMFEAKELEQLLQCFLSLNSRQYHGIIVEAFTEIWEALFCDYPMNVL